MGIQRLKWSKDVVNWHQLKDLIIVGIKMDFRSSRGFVGQSKKWSPLVTSCLFYFLMGCSMAISLRLNVSPFYYTFFILLYAMTMMALAVIIEFGNTIFSPEDNDVLTHRPIGSVTYFLAKLINFVFYIALIGTALLLGPTLIGIGLYDESPVFPFIFYFIGLFSLLFTGALVILIYAGLLYKFKDDRFKSILAYLQIGLTFILVLFCQLIPKLGYNFFDPGLETRSRWLFFIPAFWFSDLVYGISGSGKPMLLTIPIILFSITLLIMVFTFSWISKRYSQLVSQIQTNQESESKVSTNRLWILSMVFQRIWKGILPKPEAQAGFYLTDLLLKKDRSIKLVMYGVFAIPLSFFIIALVEGRLVDPFYFNPFEGQQSSFIMAIFFIFFMIHFLITGIVHINDWQAAWVFYSAPISSPGHFYRGVKLALFLRFMIPFYLFLGILYTIQIPAIHAIKHTITLFLIGMVAFSSLSFLIKDYPFSKRRDKGSQRSFLSFIFFMGPFFLLTVTIQTFAYQVVWGWWLVQGIFLSLLIMIEGFSSKRIDRILGKGL